MSFGKMPLGNAFRSPNSEDEEYFFELAVGHCDRCGMVQLAYQPDARRMFHENYAFFSSTSVRMVEHFERFSEFVRRVYLPAPDALVVEIGSNDGILLRHFAVAGIQHVGVEPSLNVAEVARERGVNTIDGFFDLDVAHRIVTRYGQADAILAANVMCHIRDISSVVIAVDHLLKPNGVLIFEDPYLGDIVEKTSYDQIYDEHVFFFSVGSVKTLMNLYGFEIIDVQPQPVHGGSMRYVIAREGAQPISPRVGRQLEREEHLGLGFDTTYQKFRKRVERSRDQLMSLLSDVRSSGKRVVGYAATSKSTTVINYCGITSDLVEYICDTTPLKQGKVSPGRHIPIRPHEEFAADYPDYAVLFGWNHAEEILLKEKAYTEAGGRWIVYVPEVQVRP